MTLPAELHGFEGEVDLVEAACDERLGLRGVRRPSNLRSPCRVSGRRAASSVVVPS